MGEAVLEVYATNGSKGCGNHPKNGLEKCDWFEEEVDKDVKLSYALNCVLHEGSSHYQDIVLLDTKHFGKALVIDGKMQSTEMDEFIYHECLVHPALLFHPNPKTVFIMGGGEGSAAREVLKHNTIHGAVMCDIDQEVVAFCKRYLTVNYKTFVSDKLCLVINDAKFIESATCGNGTSRFVRVPMEGSKSAHFLEKMSTLLFFHPDRSKSIVRAELEKRQEKYDVIIGDLSDPVEGGPCYQLYTKSFYENLVKPKLNYRGIFVTQAGPAGVFTHKEVFTSIYNTLKHVFKYVKAYTAHIPSFVDTWGWVMASDHPFSLTAEEIDQRIMERIEGELLYLNGDTLISATTMNKPVHHSLLKETHIYSEDNARFIYGHGRGCEEI